MSAQNQLHLITLEIHSQFVKAGSRAAVKTSQSRAKRRKGKTDLADEVSSILPSNVEQIRLSDLHDLSQVELDAYADSILYEASADVEHFDDRDDFLLEADSDSETTQIPLYLQASLPDWMLNELESANGDAFHVLSLFEAKRVSPQARISMEDEALYA